MQISISWSWEFPVPFESIIVPDVCPAMWRRPTQRSGERWRGLRCLEYSIWQIFLSWSLTVSIMSSSWEGFYPWGSTAWVSCSCGAWWGVLPLTAWSDGTLGNVVSPKILPKSPLPISGQVTGHPNFLVWGDPKTGHYDHWLSGAA